jgi:hypothetical protein
VPEGAAEEREQSSAAAATASQAAAGCGVTGIGQQPLPMKPLGGRWYPHWFAATFLFDTAEDLVEEHSNLLTHAAVCDAAHRLSLHALGFLAHGPVWQYRCQPCP